MRDDLQVDNRLLRHLLEAVEDHVVVVDRAGRIRYVNFTGDGYSPGEVVGADASEFVHPEYREAHQERLRRILERGVPELFSVPGVGAPGEREWYSGTASPIRRDGQSIGLIVVLKNVTELRRSQREASQLKKLLPVCPWCSSKVRVAPDRWVTLEEYLYSKGDVYVTHGMCPECGDRMVEDADRSAS